MGVSQLTPTSSQTISALVNGKRPLPEVDIRDVGDIARSWGS